MNSANGLRTHAPLLIRRMGALLSGAALAQAVQFVALPIIAARYGSHSYGVYSIYLSLAGTISIIFTMQLGNGIIVSRSDKHAGYVFVISSSICVTLSLLSYIPITILLYRGSDLSAIYIPIMVFLSCIDQLQQGLLIRRAMFREIGFISVSRAIIMTSLQILFSYVSYNEFGLISGYCAALTLAVVGQAYLTHGHVRFYGIPKLRKSIVVLKRNRDFIGYGTAQEFLASFAQSAPIFIIGSFYGPALAGQFSLALRLILTPFQIFGNTVRQVLFENFSQLRDNYKEIMHRVEILTFFASIAGGIVIAGCFWWVDNIIIFIAGSEWIPASIFAQSIIFWAPLAVINVPVTLMMRVVRMQRQAAVINICLIFVRIAAMMLAVLAAASVFWVVGMFVTASVLGNIALIVLGLRQGWLKITAAYIATEKL